MGFIDLFRPKHSHSESSVRAEAVRQLGTDEADLVAKIARTDSDPSVRRIAIEKLEDADMLASLAESESDQSLREHARARAAQVWTSRAVTAGDAATGEEAIAGLIRIGNQRAVADVAGRAVDARVREAALAKIDEPRALADLARNASAQVAARTAAIARIDDPDVLRGIAVDEQHKDTALAVLERIDDPAALEMIVAKAKSKAARTRARKKLAEIAPAVDTSSPEDKRRHAERVQLLRRAEALAQGAELRATAEDMAAIEREWADLGAGDDADLASRFERACKRYHARRPAATEVRGNKAEAAGKAEAAREAPAPARDSEQDQATAGGAEGSDAKPAEATGTDASAEPARAAEAGPEAPTPETQNETQNEVQGEAKPEGDAVSAAPDEQEKLRRQEAERERQEGQARSLAALTQLTRDLEAAVENNKRRQVDRTLQRADKAFGELDLPPGSDGQVTQYRAAHQAAVVKARELREAEDWERWANVPRQEALIAKAEALLEDEDDSKLIERLKTLQTEWKAVGPVPQKKSRELWDRFKSTCDKVYDRVKAGRARANEEMGTNLRRKEALCERVEVLAESTDWDATAEEIKQLQREWREIGPVPRKKSDAVWKRFRAACDRFFERRKPHLEERLAELTQNLNKKQAMCERAETLAEGTDWRETSIALRDLQREWRDVGPVPRKEANAINKRFRAVCDRFFQRREESQKAERRAREQAVASLQAEILALVEGTEPPAARAASAEGAEGGDSEPPAEDAAAGGGSLAERALAIRATLRELPMSAGQEKEIQAVADRLYRKALAEEPEAFRGTELDPGTNRQRKLKLCARAEDMAPASAAPAGPVETQTPEQIAERLRAALAQNALGGSLAKSTDSRHIADSLAELESSWQRLGPVPGPEGEALEERFRAACERARQGAGLS